MIAEESFNASQLVNNRNSQYPMISVDAAISIILEHSCALDVEQVRNHTWYVLCYAVVCYAMLCCACGMKCMRIALNIKSGNLNLGI